MTDQADTPDPIGEWLALAEAASPAPWEASRDGGSGEFYGSGPEHDGFDVDDVEGDDVAHGGPIEDGGPHVGACSHENARFIAASRNVVPAVRALVAEVRALRAEVDQAQSERDAHRSARDWYEQQLRERTAELAAARDREAAVLAMHPKQTTHLSGGGGVLSDSAGFKARAAQFLGLPVEYCGRCQNPEVQRWPCATVAALSQSEPTKETP